MRILQRFKKQKGITISAWFRDGVVYDVYGTEQGEVYLDGELFKTDGKSKLISVVLHNN